MAKGFKHGTSGNPLNFKVVPGLTQPGTAAENTIWVDTDRINNYYFSATQPEGMVDYDVWFPVGTSSTVEFNALKKNGIQLHPVSAKQMISGELLDKTAKIWHSGEWIKLEFNLYLYNEGDDCADVTGGWSNSGWPNLGNVSNANGKLTFNFTSGVNSAGGATNNKIDISQYRTLRAIGEHTTTSTTVMYVGIYDSKSINSPLARATIPANSVFDITLDIERFSGEYYIFFFLTGYVTKVVLEP